MEPINNWTRVDPWVLLPILRLCDGSSVLHSGILKERGIPAPLVDRLTKTHLPGRDGVYSIQSMDNKPAQKSVGVFSLDLLFDLAKDMGLAGSFARAKEGIKGQDEQWLILMSAILRYFHRLKR